MATLFPSTAARQPFAPIVGSRLQNLTSVKNRQNAVSILSPSSKRKAVVYDDDLDSENINPELFLSPKRTKGREDKLFKASPTFVLTKASSSQDSVACSPMKDISRPILQARSPAPKINTSTPMSAPAGRSPTRKRVGILNRRKTGSPFTRVDPPKFSVGSGEAPFSIAAALSGTIPSYGARQQAPAAAPIPAALHEPEQKAGWFFDIHEDTAEETLTNLMEHSTCTLDISSDEETLARYRDERGKENVPPIDDVSQSQARLPEEKTTRSARLRKAVSEGAIDIDRSPLGDLAAEEFYADGCLANDVVLVGEEGQEPSKTVCTFDFSVESLVESAVDSRDKGKGRAVEVEELMTKSEEAVPQQAALFAPLEKAEEGFEVWESGSAKGDD